MEENIIDQLIKLGYTKYKISRIVGCSWLCVYNWQRGIFKPREENRSKLEKLLECKVK